MRRNGVLAWPHRRLVPAWAPSTIGLLQLLQLLLLLLWPHDTTAAAALVASTVTAAAAAEVHVSSLLHAAPHAALAEGFDPGWENRWTHSEHEMYSGRFAATRDAGDDAVYMPSVGTYGMAAELSRPLAIGTSGLVVQFEVPFRPPDTCIGSYIKLLPSSVDGVPLNLRLLHRSTPFVVLFGPDKCGDAHGQVHLILRHRRHLTGEQVEKHLARVPPMPADDTRPHVYTLSVRTDATFKILVDGISVVRGSLLEEMEPPLVPPALVPDPHHLKPADWEDEESVPDPHARRPDGWDDRETVPDSRARQPKGWLEDEPHFVPVPGTAQPDGWDEQEDGEWQPPMMPNPSCVRAVAKGFGCGPWEPPHVRNPAYKGPWVPPRIPNPNFIGHWEQRMVPNPDYNAGDAPLSNLADIGAVAFELLAGAAGCTFDNVYVGTSEREAAALRTAFEVRAMRRAPLTFVAPDKLSARSAVHTGRLRPFTLAA